MDEEYPEVDRYGHQRTPYAVQCFEHGLVYLDEKQYDFQMNRPNSLWRCPICGESAQWDDENYERGTEFDDWDTNQ